MKYCPQCEQQLPIEKFSFHAGRPDGLESWCKPCAAEKLRQWRKRNPGRAARDSKRWQETHRKEFKRAQLNKDLQRLYKIGFEEWTTMLLSQTGRCAVCGEAFDERIHFSKASVDHDHESEQLRELIHKKCNLLLGIAEDNIELLEKAIEYLKRHRSS